MPKIDYFGNYLLFRGVTLISPIKQKDVSEWKKLHDLLAGTELIAEHYSLLPYHSYHMTLNNLYTEEEIRNIAWGQFINENSVFFQNLDYIVSRMELNPEITITSDVSTQNVIQLHFSLPDEHRRQMEFISNSLQVQHKLPSSYHMTLGYQIPAYPIDSKTMREVRGTIERVVDEVFPSRRLNLAPPRLCYFNSMEAFIPWDGRMNPFPSIGPQSIFVDSNMKQPLRVDEEEDDLDGSGDLEQKTGKIRAIPGS